MILKKHNKSNKNNLTILTLALVIGGVMQGVAAQVAPLLNLRKW